MFKHPILKIKVTFGLLKLSLLVLAAVSFQTYIPFIQMYHTNIYFLLLKHICAFHSIQLNFLHTNQFYWLIATSQPVFQTGCLLRPRAKDGCQHPAHSSLHKESPAELMLLTLVWDETASGTARSKTGNGLHSWSAPRFGMGQDCLWDREEQNRE